MQLGKKTTNQEFSKKMVKLIYPIAFQQFMLVLVSASDALMLGNVSQDFLSAVSLAAQVQFVLSLFLAAMTIGTSIFAAQSWGRRDIESIEKLFGMVMKVTAVVAGIFTIAALTVPDVMMKLFTNNAVLIELGKGYLRNVALSYLLCGISQIYLCILKNSGLAVHSMLISSTVVILNIAFNAILIFGLFGMPKMGIVGAALATVLARAVEAAWVVLESLKKNRIHLIIQYLHHIDPKLKADFWKVTFPLLGNQIVWGCGFTMTSVIMGRLGTDAVAANSIANLVKNLVSCVCIGIGNGGGIMIGNALGAGRLKEARQDGRRLCKMAIICGIASGILILAFIPLVLSVVNMSADAAYYLKWMMAMCSYYMIGKSISSTTIGGIFPAGGDSKFGLICDTVTLWCVTVPLGLLAAFVFKMPVLTIYLIVNLDEIVKLPAIFRHYKKYLWVKSLTIEAL